VNWQKPKKPKRIQKTKRVIRAKVRAKIGNADQFYNSTQLADTQPELSKFMEEDEQWFIDHPHRNERVREYRGFNEFPLWRKQEQIDFEAEKGPIKYVLILQIWTHGGPNYQKHVMTERMYEIFKEEYLNSKGHIFEEE
jgi:mannosyltransferase OCH1-like enzyme